MTQHLRGIVTVVAIAAGLWAASFGALWHTIDRGSRR